MIHHSVCLDSDPFCAAQLGRVPLVDEATEYMVNSPEILQVGDDSRHGHLSETSRQTRRPRMRPLLAQRAQSNIAFFQLEGKERRMTVLLALAVRAKTEDMKTLATRKSSK